MPQLKYPALQGSKESIDVATVLIVEVNRHLVFFIEIKPSQMRRRFISEIRAVKNEYDLAQAPHSSWFPRGDF
jgi:hypothetical protein